VRVFSEGTRAVETPAEADKRRYNGGEVDSPSRQLARFMDGLADKYLANFDVTMVYRTDRFSRGGDQVEMLKAGFPAVRVTEANENYTRQHQDLRTENGIKYGDVIEGVDFAYLAQVTRLNIISMAALASCARPAHRRGHQGRGLRRHHGELGALARRGAYPAVVALHHRSAVALQPRRRSHRPRHC
jgi:hypothetical protein